LVGNKLFCHQSALSSVMTIPWINVDTDMYGGEVQISTVGRAWSMWAVVGNRLFISLSATSLAVIPYINADVTPPTAGEITGLPNRTHNQMLVTGNKLYVSSSTATTSIVVISGTTATIIGGAAPLLPSRNYNMWYDADATW